MNVLASCVVLCLTPLVAARSQEPAPVAGKADRDWMEGVGAQMRRLEYHFTEREPGVFGAPNRSQGLRLALSTDGLTVFPRTIDASGDGAPWRLRLGTRSIGRGADAFELQGAQLRAREARLELDHGVLVEWFENRSEGVEHGWTIPAPLMDPLWIGLEVGGDLSFRIEAGQRSAVLVDACGEVVLRYAGLHAFDAAGRDLDARLLASPEGVGIEVDTTGALYPITVDPLLTFTFWTTVDSNQSASNFGIAVAAAGDVNGDGYSDVIIGADLFDAGQSDEGRAFVHHGSAAGLSATPDWTAESDQAGAGFGRSVALAGDVNGDGYSDVIVGAPLLDNGQSDEGKVFVYLGSASGLAATPAWTAESDQATAEFGSSVSTAGDVSADGYSDVLVGAPFYDSGMGDQEEGWAFVYHGSASGLAASATWTAQSDHSGAHFGSSVSAAGDVNGDGYSDVIVGAPRYDDAPSQEGWAFVYHGSASGLAANAAWTAESDEPNAEFGGAVSSVGDVNGDGYSDVIVGAIRINNGQVDEGRAYVYHGSPGGLGIGVDWMVEGDQANALFAGSVGTAGDVNGDGFSDVIVGSALHDSGQSDEGCAFVYLGAAGGLFTSPRWTFEGQQAGAWCGYAVGTAGDVNADGYSDILIAALLRDGDQTDEGRVFVYHGGSSWLAATPSATLESNQALARLGASVSSAGDVNGDGYSDVVVGAPWYDAGEADEGVAFLHLGSATGITVAPAWSAEGNQVGADLGSSVGSCDVNGDGFSDVLIGAPGFSSGELEEGAAFVFHGSESGLPPSSNWMGDSDQPSSRFGASLASAGDVNGDGYGDVLVGASLFDDGGRVFAYHGSPLGLSTAPAWTAEENQDSAYFGFSVSTAGDVDGDGFSDVIIGAPWHEGGQIQEGQARVFLGSASGLEPTPSWTAESDVAGAWFGYSVSTAGDVNGDGYSDVIVGVPRVGEAFVYHGGPVGLGTSPAWSRSSFNTDLGISVAGAGDVDGDGYSDVILGSILSQDGLQAARAEVHLGSSSGLLGYWWSAVSSLNSIHVTDLCVASAGDVNGDGYGDVIFGAPHDGVGESQEGLVRVYLGNDGAGGHVRVLQQRDRSSSRPLSVLGRTDSSGLFHLYAEFARTPARFGWATPELQEAWLEWEIAPLGVTFDGTRIQRGTPQPLEPAGGPLLFDETITVDDDRDRARTTRARSYHWRARVATNNPLFPHTAWFSVPGNNVSEAKLRKPAQPF